MSRRIGFWLDDEIDWEPTPWGFGSAGYVSGDTPVADPVAELHKVIEEVTGKPVAPPPRRIGFMPW